MAYFSNGSDGMHFEDKWCSRCLNYPDDGASCEIIFLHQIYQGEDKCQPLLDSLITRKDRVCKMFISKKRYKEIEVE